jgi:hypothetical protein
MLVGGATVVLFPLAWLLRRQLGLETSEFAVGFLTFYAAVIINDPHFAVTYLLFYKDVNRRALGTEFSRAQRGRYMLAGFFVPAGLVLWAACALSRRSAESLGWMIQLMFLLVGWHYVKQGFGVLTVLSARRGIRLTQRDRILFLVHCFAGWAFAWANPSAVAGEFEEKGVVYFGVAHPHWLELIAGLALAMSTLALAGHLLVKWLRHRESLPLVPLAGFLISVWSWTIYSSLDPLMQYVIPALHSIQYLYFVSLMKRNEAREAEGPPTFGRPVAVRLAVLAFSAIGLGWLLFRGVPGILDGAFAASARSRPSDLGQTPYFAALFTIVNIHHYFMDHVIWRRDNPDTRYLHARTRASLDAG